MYLFIDDKGNSAILWITLKMDYKIRRFLSVCVIFNVLFLPLQTQMLNKHLSSLMPGLTAKVFRTYNASVTLQQQLKDLGNSECLVFLLHFLSPIFILHSINQTINEHSTSRKHVQLPDVQSCRQYGCMLEHLLKCLNMMPIWIAVRVFKTTYILTTVSPQEHMDIVSVTVCLNFMQAS